MSKVLTINPKITADVEFQLDTPDDEGCFDANPFKVDRVAIFYLKKNFSDPFSKEFEALATNEQLEQAAVDAAALACETPTDANIADAAQARSEADVAAITQIVYYNEAVPTKLVGLPSPDQPAWLSTADDEDNFIHIIEEDDEGNPWFGRFKFTWSPEFAREGDYFICWTWTPLPAGTKLTSSFHFTVSSDADQLTAIPTHRTVPDKYKTLLDRYTPGMYQQILCDGDLTPSVLDRLHEAISDGFIVLEDLAVQTIDLLDANATHETFLNLLSNMFNLRLRSNDPTRWRSQIKRAIPLYKKKGTYGGLEEAYQLAGMTLSKVTNMWQVLPKYTWREVFTVATGQLTFELEKTPIDLIVADPANFSLELRLAGSEEWIVLNSDYVTFTVSEGVATMTWVGEDLSVGAIILAEDDLIRVMYKVLEVPSPSEQTLEDYIRDLDLMDQRDVDDQESPPINWNTRVIEEDDPLFDLVIPSRHPYFDLTIWGKIRTEFPFSENIYNMDEWNGSKRDSTDPCDIDKEFVDNICQFCRSSKISVDVEIQELTNDRLVEALDIIDEYTPFHTVLHRLNFSGGVEDVITSPEEEVEIAIWFNKVDTMLAGHSQTIFARATDQPALAEQIVLRDLALASSTEVASTSGETANNTDMVLYSDDVDFSKLGLDLDYGANQFSSHTLQDNILQILGPHALKGTYYDALSEPGKYLIKVDAGTFSEPIDPTTFTFRISNSQFDTSSATIVKDNLSYLSDDSVDFVALGVSPGWSILIPEYDAVEAYTVLEVLGDGRLLLADPDHELGVNDSTITYTVRDALDATVVTHTTGALTVFYRARVELTHGTIDEIRNFVKIGDYLAYPLTPTPAPQYRVMSFVEGEGMQLHVESNTTLNALLSPSVGGVIVAIWRRKTADIEGNLTYRGMELTTAVDYESTFVIQNGENPPVTPLDNNERVENYLVEVTTDPGGANESVDYYAITEWDGVDIVLDGPYNEWTLAGTSVDVRFLRFDKTSDVIIAESPQYESQPGHTFPFIDRSGNEVIQIVTETAPTMMFWANAMSAASHNQVLDTTGQDESITFEIEYKKEDQ